ncbi:MAG: sialidase family protein [Candidatus Tyrphobacter sp.]
MSSALRNTPHYETLIAADPSNARHLIACSTYELHQPSLSEYGTVVYVSSNGGTSWKPTLNVTAASFGSGDPACAFGRDGNAYFAELEERKGPDGKQHGHTVVYASHDGGERWGRPFVGRQSDREYIAVDTTGGRFNGRVYVNGAMSLQSLENDPRRINQITNNVGVLVSTDHGRSFHLEALLSPLDDHYTFADGNAVVMSDGTYVVLYPDLENEYATPAVPGEIPFALKVISSTDGGFSFTKAVTVAKFTTQKFGIVSVPPSMAVDTSNGPFRNRLYVTWAQLSDGRSQIFLSYSSDKGKTWSAPVTVSDDLARKPGEGPDANEPEVAVNRKGIVGVSWMDRRDSAHDLGYYERFTASFDGGETFAPSVRVATSPATFYRGSEFALDAMGSGGGDPTALAHGQPLQATIGYNSRFSFIGGDTEGLAADSNGIFHALWVDNRTGVPQAWTAPIEVSGEAVPNGSPQLAHERDITKDVAIEFGDARFDRANAEVSVDAYLVDTSKISISGPVQARLITLTSGMGRPRLIVGSENGIEERGAIVDFTSSLPDGKLAPNERARAVHLVFHIDDLRPDTESASTYADSLQDFVTFTARVFSPA